MHQPLASAELQKFHIHPSWQDFLLQETSQDYFQSLVNFLREEYNHKTIYPPQQLIFSALSCDLQQTHVVILGQDPYHEPGQSHGLAFSVQEGIKIPPSLCNIYKEIHSEFDTAIPTTGDLTRWAEQGILLLNNVLTVEAHHAGSHRKHGWEIFTRHLIDYLNTHCEHLVFLLWGNDAKTKAEQINPTKHLILTAAHPSPLSASRGFFGCNHFRLCNQQLKAWGLPEINW